MSVRSAQAIVVEFTTSSFTTGAATNADSTPTGTLVVNGVDNAASVTVTNIDTGRYKASVTLPTLAVGDIVELSIAATVGTIAGKGIVWRDTKDMVIDANGLVDTTPTAATIADAVCDELLSGHTTAGTVGAALNLIGTSTITIVGPVASGGNVTIVRGDTYYDADGRALEWTSESAGDWPTLTSAAITMRVWRSLGGPLLLTKSGTVTVATGANKSVMVELTATDTDLLAGVYLVHVTATLTNGHTATLVDAAFTVVGPSV